MHLEPFFLPGLGCLSYLVGDGEAGEGVVVDPQIVTSEYEEAARRAGLRIAHVLDTHLHADHLSGVRALARATGARIHAPATARVRYGHAPLADGDELAVGRVRLRARATPGHTPEHLALEVRDGARSGASPYAVLTGDVLFVGGVGRPDLVAGADPRDLARRLHASVRGLAALPGGTLLHPGHGPGSACGSGIGETLVSSIGYERETHALFGSEDRDAFVEKVLADLPPGPGNAANLKRMNAEGPPVGLPPTPPTLSAGDLAAATEGALVLDVRSPQAFAAGHVPGSISVEAGRTFAPRAAPLLEWNLPVVLVMGPDGDEVGVVADLARVGGVHLRGRAEYSSWEGAGHPAESLRLWEPAEAAESVERGRARLLDIRTREEWEAGHLAGARWLPWERIVREDSALPDGEWIVVCGSGVRSSLAASVLRRRGREGVGSLRGGMLAWRRAVPA